MTVFGPQDLAGTQHKKQRMFGPKTCRRHCPARLATMHRALNTCALANTLKKAPCRTCRSLLDRFRTPRHSHQTETGCLGAKSRSQLQGHRRVLQAVLHAVLPTLPKPHVLHSKTAQIRAVCVFWSRGVRMLLSEIIACYVINTSSPFKQEFRTAMPPCVCTKLLTHACLIVCGRCCCCQVHPTAWCCPSSAGFLHCRCCDFQFFTTKKMSLSKTDINKEVSFPFECPPGSGDHIFFFIGDDVFQVHETASFPETIVFFSDERPHY